MRGSRISAVFMAAVIWGCQDDDSNDGAGQCTSQSRLDLAVGDAIGPTLGPRCSCESTTRELALSEVDEVLGFSAEDVLEKIEGDYALAMVWGDACEDENAQTDGCNSEAPDFTGSETEVLISVARAATTARVDDCVGAGQEPQCRITWLIVPVAGTLATSDGLLDEEFEAEMRVRCADDVKVVENIAGAALEGTLPSRMSGLSRIAWAFGVTEADAVFEVSVIAGTRTRVWAKPPDGGRTLGSQSWGVADDLQEARQ